MGCQRLIVLSAFLVLAKDYEVSAQYATVLECLTQPTAIARPIVQPAAPYILPAIIQPDFAPSYPNYGNCPAPYPGYPPIVVKDDDDLLRNLLYFLIFSMGNKKDNCNAPVCCGGSSCGSGKCKCCCDCANCSKNNAKDTDISSSAPIYIPVPIAIPVYMGPDGCRYIDGFCDDILIQDCYCNCNSGYGKDPGEINLIIRTE